MTEAQHQDEAEECADRHALVRTRSAATRRQPRQAANDELDDVGVLRRRMDAGEQGRQEARRSPSPRRSGLAIERHKEKVVSPISAPSSMNSENHCADNTHALGPGGRHVQLGYGTGQSAQTATAML